MALVRWAPGRDLYPVQSEINRLFTTLFDTATPVAGRVARQWTPALDVVENDGDYVVRADLPGWATTTSTSRSRTASCRSPASASPNMKSARTATPDRALVWQLRAVADPPRGCRARVCQGKLRKGRARDSRPEARGAQGPHGRDHERRRGVSLSAVRRHRGGPHGARPLRSQRVLCAYFVYRWTIART